MFFSVHLFDQAKHSDYEFYPGTGDTDDVLNNIVNVPLAPLWRRPRIGGLIAPEVRKRRNSVWLQHFYASRWGRPEFRRQMTQRLIPAIRAYCPDMLLVSAGFDAGDKDVGNGRYCGRYIGGIDLQAQDYAWITSELMSVARICCKGRLVSVLEGGEIYVYACSRFFSFFFQSHKPRVR